jgi:hypothetical protein
MKKRLSLLIVLNFVALAFVFTQTPEAIEAPKLSSDIQGAWKMVERNGVPVPEGVTQIKMITGSRFMWMLTNAQGIVMDCAGGTYTLEGGAYTETIDMAPHPGSNVGKLYPCQVSIAGNRLYQMASPANGSILEVYERIN